MVYDTTNKNKFLFHIYQLIHFYFYILIFDIIKGVSYKDSLFNHTLTESF